MTYRGRHTQTSNIYLKTRKRNLDEARLPVFFDGQNIHDVFCQYSMAKLQAACQKFISTAGARTRFDMYTTIARAPEQIQETLREMVHGSVLHGERMYARRIAVDGPEQGSVPLTQDSEGEGQHSMSSGEELLENPFMRAGSTEALNDAVIEFIDRTGNSALAVGVCAVCARESSLMELTLVRLDAFPNCHWLRPEVVHPAHDIFNGMLLHPKGVESNEEANICIECGKALESDKIPKFALANGLWIGKVPHELAYLTLPERLLIAKYFPAAYIIKLYPKKKGARHWDKRQMHSGLKGNVSTYQLDQGQIASMIDGTIMPQPANILAATIGITFVGPKNLPDRGLPDQFKVRRGRVQTALEWLKQNNPLYSNVTIWESQLAGLPENDVPYEMRATAKLSTDTQQLYAEQDGYVPSQEACEDDVDEGKIKVSMKSLKAHAGLQSVMQARARMRVSVL